MSDSEESATIHEIRKAHAVAVALEVRIAMLLGTPTIVDSPDRYLPLTKVIVAGQVVAVVEAARGQSGFKLIVSRHTT